tara:strand:- start:2829 stop:3548 length:720 start_codon:yes stop_codon:yes gene_type:complete
MTNKNILIIGSSGGIGKAFANFYSQDPNNKIIGLSRSQENFEESLYANHYIDLEKEDTIENAALTVSEHSPFQLIIIASGILHAENLAPEKSYKHISAENFKKILNVNTIGPALVGKFFIPLLDSHSPSVMAFLSARVGSISDNRLGGWHAYRSSKASLNMIIKNFSLEVSRTNKQASIIGLHPGTVNTELSKPFQKNVAESKLFSPEFSAGAMAKVIDNLKQEDTGSVLAFDGSKIES